MVNILLMMKLTHHWLYFCLHIVVEGFVCPGDPVIPRTMLSGGFFPWYGLPRQIMVLVRGQVKSNSDDPYGGMTKGTGNSLLCQGQCGCA